jgi:hypothetical protein
MDKKFILQFYIKGNVRKPKNIIYVGETLTIDSSI